MKKGTAITVISILTALAVAFGALYVTNNNSKTKEIEALTADVAGRDDQISTLNADVADKAGQIEALTADVAGMDEQISALNADAADKAGQIETLNAELSDRDSSISALQEDVKAKTKTIEELTASVAEKEASIAELQQNVESVTGENTSLTEDVAEMTAAVAEHKIQIGLLKDQVAELEAAIQEKKEKEQAGASAEEMLALLRDRDNPENILGFVSYFDAPTFSDRGLIVGERVVKVISGSSASKAGLRTSDIITAVNGVLIGSDTQLAGCLAALQPGEEAVLTVYRAGKIVRIAYPSPLQKAEPADASADGRTPEAPDIAVGSVVTFGRYEQDNNKENGKEPIEWIVIGVNDDSFSLISKDILDIQPYHTEKADVLWAGSSLRSWLNSSFLSLTFLPVESRQMIAWEYQDTDGATLNDSVYCLSAEEAEAFWPAEAERVAGVTEAVFRKADYTDAARNGRWWLRSASVTENGVRAASDVDAAGAIGTAAVRNAAVGIRPCICVKKSAFIPELLVSVNGEEIKTDHEYLNNVISYYIDYVSYNGYDATSPSMTQTINQYSLQYTIRTVLMQQKAKEFGIGAITDEERAGLEAEAKAAWEGILDNFAANSGLVTEASTEEEKAAARAAAAAVILTSDNYDEARYVKESVNSGIVALLQQRVTEYLLQGKTVTEEDIRQYFDGLVSADEEKYKGNIAMYEYYTQYYGQSSYYVPEGYRAVNHILLKVDEELLNNWKELTSRLEEQQAAETGTDETAAEAPAETSDPVTQEMVDAAEKAILESVQSTVDEINAKLAEGASFEDLIVEYGTDPGMQDEASRAKGYYVHQDSILWDPVFTSAAMELEKTGDVSRPVVSQFGVHILQYLKDIPGGAIELTDEMKAEFSATLLQDMQNEALTNALNEWTAEAEIVYTEAGEAWKVPAAEEQ